MKISDSDLRGRRRPARALLAAATLAGFFSFGSALAAEPVDDTTKNAARELAAQAAEALQAGDYAKAQDLYHRAYVLVPAPTLSLREARALEKLGRLVEAVEAYVRTTRTPLEPSSPRAYRQAVQEGYDELAKLRPRVPKLTITLAGSEGEVSVTLDGKPVKPALIGVAQPINPGEHTLEAIGDRKRGKTRVTLAEAESKSVTIQLDDDPNARLAPAAAETGSAPAEVDRGPETETPSGGTQRTLGFVALGVGAVGLGTGVVTGLMASSKHSSAEDGCPNGQCVAGSSAADDLESFRTLRTISTIGYAAGIVGVAAGVTLLLTAPSDKSAGHVSPWVGVGSAGVVGSFR